MPPSLAELRARLKKRGESEVEIEKRLDKVREEISEASGYDYVIFNDQLEEAAERLQAIYRAEKSRAGRMRKYFLPAALAASSNISLKRS